MLDFRITAAMAALLLSVQPAAAEQPAAKMPWQKVQPKNVVSTELQKKINAPDAWAITHQRGLLGHVGQGNAIPFDINRDGTEELVALGSMFNGTQQLSVLQRFSDKPGLQIVRQSEHITGMLRLVFHDEQGRALALIGDDYLKLVDLGTMQVVAVRNDYASSLTSAAFVDYNNSGQKSLLIHTWNEIQVLSLADLSTQNRISTGSAARIGSFVGAGKLSVLAYETDYSGSWPYKCLIKVRQYEAGNWVDAANVTRDGYCASGSDVRYADVNIDGATDILWRSYSGSSHEVSLLDLKSSTVRWTYNLPSSSHYPAGLADVNGDNENDLVLYAEYANAVSAVNGVNGAALSVPYTTDKAQIWFVSMDVDGDGKRDVVGPSGRNMDTRVWTGIKVSDGSQLWVNDASGSAVTGVAEARDGAQRILVSLSGEAYSYTGTGRFLMAYSADDLSVKWSVELIPPSAYSDAALAVFAHDNDGDGRDEVNVLARRENRLVLFVVDVRTGAYATRQLSGYIYGNTDYILQDMNDDQLPDLVIAAGGASMAYDLRNNTILATALYDERLSGIQRFVGLDLDGDGKKELYAETYANNQRRIIRVGRNNNEFVVESMFDAPFGPVTQLLSFDVDADGREELLFAGTEGDLSVLSEDGKRWDRLITACTGSHAVARPVSATELLVFCGTQSVIYDAQTRSAAWVSKQLPSPVISHHAVAVTGDASARRIYTGGAKLSRLTWVGHVRKPLALPSQLRTHWRTASSVDLPVQNPNPSLSLTATVTVNPGKGSAAVAGTRLTYTPSGTSLDTDTLYYTVSNGYLSSDPAKVDIVRTNTTPVAGGGSSVSVTAGQNASGTIQALDADADPLSYRVTTAATKGTFTINANGSYSYQANASATGSDTVTLVASDGIADSQPVSISFNITAPAKSGGGGGGAAAAIGLLLVLGALRRKRAH